ncbi:MAG TPA: maleylpyruvate isomerase family mycothiol-dependent enzyme [Propionibacteriaceae bacterium]
MSWNAMTYEGKDTVLGVVRDQAEGFFKLAEVPETWTTRTACPEWEVRDIVGHIVDTTETYFVGFDAARRRADADLAYGLVGMAKRAEEQGRSFRDLPQKEMVHRLRTDFDKMMGIFEALTPDDWTGLMVPHFYMGPVPAFFYPAFQLMDYGIHSWDIREGTGREHGLHSDVADLLVPFMFVIWAGTMRATEDTEPFSIGVRVTTGPNAGDSRITVSSDGMTYEQGDVSDLPTVVEFDPGSFVLTAFGRFNGGTVRGDKDLADRFLGMFFRI